MTLAHLANLGVHVAAGTIALSIGFMMLAKVKGTPTHRRLGRIFCYFTLVMCCSAAIGTVFFRFVPIFAVLSILVPYQLVGAWRCAHTRGQGPTRVDGALTALAFTMFVAVAPVVVLHPGAASIVVYSSLGALVLLLFYDEIRWLFPRRWFRVLWRYEHAYKMIASIFGMLSALMGNVVRVAQPWSQILPSFAGVLVVFYFFLRLHRQDKLALACACASRAGDLRKRALTRYGIRTVTSRISGPISCREATP